MTTEEFVHELIDGINTLQADCAAKDAENERLRVVVEQVAGRTTCCGTGPCANREAARRALAQPKEEP